MIYLLSSCETIVNKMEMEDVCSSFFLFVKKKQIDIVDDVNVKENPRQCKFDIG